MGLSLPLSCREGATGVPLSPQGGQVPRYQAQLGAPVSAGQSSGVRAPASPEEAHQEMSWDRAFWSVLGPGWFLVLAPTQVARIGQGWLFTGVPGVV